MPRVVSSALLSVVHVVFIAGCITAAEVEAAPAATMVTVTVDGSAAPDPEAKQYATLRTGAEAALVLLREGKPVRLRIEPGVYREYVNDVLRGDDELFRKSPLLIEGAGRDQVIWSGAVTRHGEEDFGPDSWQPVEGHPGVYTRAWPYRLGLENGYWHNNFGVILRNLAARREMLVGDGQLMRQILMERYDWEDPDGKAGHMDWAGGTKDKTNQPGRHVYRGMVDEPLSRLNEPWTFGVIDHPLSDAAYSGKIYMRLPQGVTPSDLKRIEVNTSNDKNRPLLAIRNKDNLTVRGITFTHAGNAMVRWAVDITAAKDVLVEDCDFVWNGGRGLHVGGEDIVIRDCRINYNGHNGFGAGPRRVLVEDVEANWNNWRGLWGGFTGWSVAGAKFGKVEDITLRRVTMIGNHCGGIWFDIKCRDLLVDRCFIWGNERPGVEFEYSDVGFGNAEVRNSVIAHNLTYGVFISDATDSRVVNNVIFNNGGGNISGVPTREQIGLKNGKREPDTAEQWQHVLIQDNLIGATGDQGMVGFVHTRTTAEQYAEMLKIVEDRGNIYHGRKGTNGFQMPDRSFVGLADWQQSIGSGLPAAESKAEDSRWVDEPSDLGEAFGPDLQTPLMTRIRALGCPLPFEEVEIWKQKQQAKRQPSEEPRVFPIAAKTPNEKHVPIDLAAVGNRPVGGSDVEKHGVYVLDPGPGTHTLAGVRFTLREGDAAALALRSKKFRTYDGRALPTSVQLPFDQDFKRLYVLHGLSYLDGPGEVGRYILIYEDGTEHVVPIRAGRPNAAVDELGDVAPADPNINDWWHSHHLTASDRAIPIPVISPKPGGQANHLYVLEIRSPHPKRQAKAIRFEASPDLDASLAVFAVTGLR